MERMLPLSCVTAEACNDAVGLDAGIPVAVVASLAVLALAAVLFRRRHTQWTFLLGVLTVITGAALAFGPGSRMASFGWFAYVPGSQSVFSPPVSTQGIAGIIVGAVGLLIVGIAIGGMLRPPRSKD